MDLYRLLISCAAAAAASAGAMALLYSPANALGLVDWPSRRKKHIGGIPLIGGLSIFVGVLAGSLWIDEYSGVVTCVLATALMLAAVGALDDRFNLSVRSRLLVQAAAVVAVASCTGLKIHTLGYVFGYHLELGALGLPLTLIAVIGLLNAFNMMDGIDGLAGGLAWVSIASILLYQGLAYWPGITVLLLLAAALLPYLAANLGVVGRKVFLGDAGSMVIGYLLAWTLINLSESIPPRLSTVDVLWCVALPTLDTLAVMVRRMRTGTSPFKADRGHIHHLLLNAGLSPRATLAILVGLAIACSTLGSITRHFTAGSNLLAFGALALIYVSAHGRVWALQQAASNAAPGRIRRCAADVQGGIDTVIPPPRLDMSPNLTMLLAPREQGRFSQGIQQGMFDLGPDLDRLLASREPSGRGGSIQQAILSLGQDLLNAVESFDRAHPGARPSP
jgi:UDP-GlcNAc:undecaprenyl-phosphate GlcNAc-1-phosphate transferase